MMTEYLIECADPAAFDKTINQFGAMLFNPRFGVYPKTPEGYYTMRVFGDAEYVEYAITNQGYGKIIKKIEEPEL